MPGTEDDHQGALNISIPLSKWLPKAYAGYSLNTNRHGDTTQQVSLYGTALKDSNLSYSVMEGYSNHEIPAITARYPSIIPVARAKRTWVTATIRTAGR